MNAKTEQKAKIREKRINATLNKVIDLFRTGNVPQAIAIVTFPPYKGLPSNQWSLTNRLIMSRSDTSDGRGIRQWNEIGRKVKKGGRAFYILAPRMIKKKNKSQNETHEQGEDTHKDAEFFLAGFIPIAVFKAEDTTGALLKYEPIELPEFPLWIKLISGVFQ